MARKQSEKKNMQLVSVDAGRSSIKSAIIRNDCIDRKKFSAKYGFANFDFLKTMEGISFDESKDLIISVDNQEKLILGDTCDKLLPPDPDKIMYVSDDEVYLKYANIYVLVSVAKLLLENSNDVVLAINLTYNNRNREDEVVGNLKGKHSVKFYDTKGNVIIERQFTITKVSVYFQGFTSLLYKAIDEDLNFDKKYTRDGLIIDIGRKTTDVTFVRMLNSVKGISYNIATETVFKFINEELYHKYQIQKETMDIERYLTDNLDMYAPDGTILDLKNLFKKALVKTSTIIRDKVKNDFNGYSSDWVILTGGGRHYFESVFRTIYKNLEAIEECVFANVLGMSFMLQKYTNEISEL